MTSKPSGDPAPQLTREHVTALHAAMAAAEPDWPYRCSLLAAALGRALIHVENQTAHAELLGVERAYYRDHEAWLRAADAYFRAVGEPLQEEIPLEEDVEQG